MSFISQLPSHECEVSNKDENQPKPKDEFTEKLSVVEKASGDQKGQINDGLCCMQVIFF